MEQHRKPTANKGFAIAGVPIFADKFVQGGSLGCSTCSEGHVERKIKAGLLPA